MKYYSAEAAAFYEQALEHDPDFVAARIGLLETARLPPEKRKALREELRGTDRSRLNDRERFLIDVLAVDHEDPEARRKVVQRYLAKHPRDPWALGLAAGDAWQRQEWETAERRYQELLEVDPNWVLARNILGYIAMAQGRFDQAEEQFRTYRYAAPDQANPHDSLGELYVLIGRYDEARAELEAALAARPDFCASYENLFRLAVVDRRPEDLASIGPRIAEHCDPEMARNYACLEVVARSFLGGDPDAPWLDERCRGLVEERDDLLLHALAMRAGRRETALAIERRIAAKLAEPSAPEPFKESQASVLLLLEGQRLLAEGRLQEAAAKLREMDSATAGWGAGGSGLFRLVGRQTLASALELGGDPAGAEEVRARLRAVNAEFERDWRGLFPAGRPPA
jgi:tetratricopeptide (TPR) repeat protein